VSSVPKGKAKSSQKRIARAAAQQQTQLALQSSILAHFLARDNHSQHSVAGAVCPPRTGHLFEFFFVVGAALERAAQINRPAPHPVMVEPVLLYQYPSARHTPPELQHTLSQIPHFAFPSGVDVRALEPGTSLSHQQEIMFAPLAALERVGASFVFLLSGSHTLLYGICVSKSEFVDVLPSMLLPRSAAAPTPAAPPASPAAGTAAAIRAVTTRCYVFLTRFPFFHLHFEVMYSVLASERLDALQRMGGEAREVGAARAILREYYELPVPDEDKSSMFELSSTLHHVKFSSPTGHEDTLIGQWCLPPFTCLLSLPNIVTLLNAVMLERRIVFVSSNVGYLSACVLSVVPLLHPFIWQGAYVPVLPNNLREYLQAPVPYIMGVHEVPHKIAEFRRTLDEAIVVVLVDTNEILMGGTKTPAASVLPPLPHFDVISTNLEAPAAKLRSMSAKKSCGSISADMVAAVAEFTHELSVYHNWLNGAIRKGMREFMTRRAAAARAAAAAAAAAPKSAPTSELRSSSDDDDDDDVVAVDAKRSSAAPPSSPPPSPPPSLAGSVAPTVIPAFDYDYIETNIDELLLCFKPEHGDFLRSFLLSQFFLFFATHIARSTDTVTLVDQKLSELGALLRTRSPGALKRDAPPSAAAAAAAAGSRRVSTSTAPRPNANLAGSSEPSQRTTSTRALSKLASTRTNDDGSDEEATTTDETDSEMSSDMSDQLPVRRFSVSSSHLPSAAALLEGIQELEL